MLAAVKRHGLQTDFDAYVLNFIEEVNEISREIQEINNLNLPFQVIHYDLHPHNVLFNRNSEEISALLDFDPLRYSQRIRDVGFGMHRFSRTFGLKTEGKNDLNADIRERAEDFLQQYLTENQLEDQEVKAIPLLIQDEALRRVTNILFSHYIKKDTTWSFDLSKQVTLLREGTILRV